MGNEDEEASQALREFLQDEGISPQAKNKYRCYESPGHTQKESLPLDIFAKQIRS